MQQTVDSINYKFIPNVVNFSNINKTKELMKNDVFEKYEAIVSVSGELIICNDISKLKKPNTKIIRESHDEYLVSLEKRNPNKDQWIYNIIDGISEQDSILYKDDKFIIVPSYTWDGKTIDKLQIMAIPLDKNLRTIRSLEKSHVTLLKHMRDITFKVIKDKYDLNSCYLKTFFHYEPSTYQLHIHFINTSFSELDFLSSVERAHSLNSVIFNIGLDSDYYKKIILERR